MKILSTIILCLTLMLQGMSQCSPDSTIITPGAHPDTLADGFVGQSYSDTVTFVSPADTFIFGFNALVDSALITSVIGLPQGLSYTCLNANCATYNTYTGANYLYNCFEVSGIPTSVATNQTISVVYIAWISTFIGPTSITDTLELVISVQCPLPSPAFTETITTTTVAFTDGTANTPTSWLWDFGDGNTSTQQNPTHNYAVAGTYTVCLTATNSCGTDSVCKSVVTTCPIPDALFSFTDTNLSVYFSDTSTVGATSWLWDFGDGNTSTQQNPTHNYAVGGTYTVCLTATNSCGTDSTCQSVSVVCGTPTAMFSSVDTGLTFYFTDLSSSQIASWQWDFGDGNTSTLQNPVHSYPQPGSYVVCLIVSNFCGNADTICDTAVVNFPVSIDALIKENLSIYPNPSDNEINIQGLDILSQYSISILDLKGTLVSSASITTSDLFSINIENLSQGSYILNVENENLNTSKRFLFHKK